MTTTNLATPPRLQQWRPSRAMQRSWRKGRQSVCEREGECSAVARSEEWSGNPSVREAGHGFFLVHTASHSGPPEILHACPAGARLKKNELYPCVSIGPGEQVHSGLSRHGQISQCWFYGARPKVSHPIKQVLYVASSFKVCKSS